ncbi:hypothetical protein L6164_004279 [Bauhinia variegata]|uniref:Uncharacterized protein n=1 Tax=Bauhinia variegata TaxID=167791 RepID=A0ACB9Q4L2_BAUVA|nr:hypothetical protein L6164_004279 [Bauhinia variegata]
MAAMPLSFAVSYNLRCNPVFLHYQLQMYDPVFSFAFAIFSITLSLLSIILIFFSVYKRLSKTEQRGQQGTPNPENVDPSILKHSLSQVIDEVHCPNENSPTHLSRSLLLEVLPSDSTKWASLLDGKDFDDPKSITSSVNEGREASDEEQRGKKKKRKSKKKKINSSAEDGVQERNEGERAKAGSDHGLRLESVCLYPFTSSSSAMQRKIKQQYDELVKCHESKKLTLAQVVQFANTLVDARNELQHKADVIQRKFVITKALLFKADRSSFDRLRQQIYKLELEQKRLEEDAFVYNWLQQQLKLSPAYKKMLEIGAGMEKAKSCELEDNIDDEFADISFEELLAQEKKDSFWQKNGKSRVSSS